MCFAVLENLKLFNMILPSPTFRTSLTKPRIFQGFSTNKLAKHPQFSFKKVEPIIIEDDKREQLIIKHKTAFFKRLVNYREPNYSIEEITNKLEKR